MNSLPENPSLENLRKRAKTLKKSWLEGDPAALERVRAACDLRGAAPKLSDCQLVLAREFGFESWRRLRVAVEAANAELPHEFVTIACLCYDDPHYDHRSFHARAHAMLREHPWLAAADIWSAAAAGNAAAIRRFLERERGLVNRPGPHGWSPLWCACYSRVAPVDAAHSTLEVAKVLLDRGADPNASTMKGNADERLDQAPRKFTALTGLFGGGSTGMANQPPHPQWREMAELLLGRGADPADEAGLSIQQGALTHEKLAILLKHGLARSGGALMSRALSLAVLNGDAESVEILLAHGARGDEKFRGKTPWEHAMGRGYVEIARRLEESGAPVSELDEVQRFVALVVAGDEPEARAMIERSPDLLARVPKALVNRAAAGGRSAAVNLAIDLGFDPDWMDEVAPLHIAAGHGNVGVVRLLMKRGASLCVREPFYDGTAIGWADFFDQRRVVEVMLNEGAICLFDALDFGRLDRIDDVLARDPAALERPFAKCISREAKPEDWKTPLARMVERGKREAVRALVERGASVTSSLVEMALEKGFDEIARLLAGRI